MISSVHETASAGDRHATAAMAAAGLAVLTLVFLGLLHVLSPEFAPSWRMVSEYANGRYGWVLSLMFLCWAISTWLLAYALYPLARTWPAMLGIGLLIVAGIGEAMAAAFDINHPLHTHAAILGMNGLPIAAMLIGVSFARAGHWSQTRVMLWLSNLPWISVVLMALAMAAFFAGLSRAGIEMSANAKPLTELPQGVVAIGGWTNRFLILTYCAWTIAAGWLLHKPATA
jgi:Protein of unknown function (DUF998)